MRRRWIWRADCKYVCYEEQVHVTSLPSQGPFRGPQPAPWFLGESHSGPQFLSSGLTPHFCRVPPPGVHFHPSSSYRTSDTSEPPGQAAPLSKPLPLSLSSKRTSLERARAAPEVLTGPLSLLSAWGVNILNPLDLKKPHPRSYVSPAPRVGYTRQHSSVSTPSVARESALTF